MGVIQAAQTRSSNTVAELVGLAVGAAEGNFQGLIVGEAVGEFVGPALGEFVDWLSAEPWASRWY